MSTPSKNKIGIWVYFFWPILFLAICWTIFWFDVEPKLGVRPRELKGLIGIATHPFFHGDFNHLINNSFPFLLLGTSMFFFYKDLSYKVFLWMFIGTGIWLWSFGRSSNHIGASGLIYSMYSFITLSGILRKNKNLLAISFLTILIYGSMTYGILPIQPEVSWEGHLAGFAMGIVLAIYYRKEGPQKVVHPLSEDDTLNELKFGKDYWKTDDQIAQDIKNGAYGEEIKQQSAGNPNFPVKITYIITPSEKKNSEAPKS